MANPTTIPEPAALRRVVVTGLGAVTPLGASLATTMATIAGMVRGERAAERSLPGTPHVTGVAAAAFDERAAFRFPKALKLADRKCRLAVAAAVSAVADAGLAADGDREGWGVLLGCSASSMQVEEIGRALAGATAAESEGVSPFAGRVLSGLHPLWLLVNLPNMIGAHVGIQLEANGPNQTVTGDAIAGLQAIGEAFLAVATGECDVAIAGGAEAPLDPFDVGCFAVDPAPRRLAEAAAIVVLEDRERALARGARIYAEVAGYVSAPSAEIALRRVLGGLSATSIGTGLPGERFGDTVAASGALAVVLALAGASPEVAPLPLAAVPPAVWGVTACGTLGQAATLLLRRASAAEAAA